MFKAFSKVFFLGVLSLSLVACGSRSGMGELEQFVQEALNREPGPIEPLPEFISYEPFTYGAAALRSPFDSPIDAEAALQEQQSSTVRPDETRAKDALEEYSLASLRMVGSMARRNARWALVQGPNNEVQRVSVGSYLGRNHGRIVAISETQIDLLEIIPSGNGGWVEKPQKVILENLETTADYFENR